MIRPLVALSGAVVAMPAAGFAQSQMELNQQAATTLQDATPMPLYRPARRSWRQV